MKITSVNNNLPALPAVVDRRGSAPQGGATQTEASAKVQLSAAAQAALEGSSGNFDAAKVERMAQAIRDGSFKADPEAIADKLITNAREQLAKTYR